MQAWCGVDTNDSSLMQCLTCSNIKWKFGCKLPFCFWALKKKKIKWDYFQKPFVNNFLPWQGNLLNLAVLLQFPWERNPSAQYMSLSCKSKYNLETLHSAEVNGTSHRPCMYIETFNMKLFKSASWTVVKLSSFQGEYPTRQTLQ